MGAFLLRHTKACRLWIVVSIFLTAISVGLSVFSPIAIGRFIDFLVSGKDISVFYRYIFLLIFFWVGDIVLSYIKGIVDAKINIKLMYSINLSAIEHAKKIRYAFFMKTDSAYLNQCIHQDSNVLANFIMGGIIGTAFKIINLFALLIILCTINATVALLIWCLLPAYILSYCLFKKPLHRTKKETMEVQNRFFAKINEQLYKIKTIKLNSWYHDLGAVLLKQFETVRKVSMKNLRVSYLFNGTDKFIRFAGNLCLYIFCGLAILQKQMTVGEFTIISSYFLSVIVAFGGLFAFGKTYQEAKVSYDRTGGLFQEPVEQNGSVIINPIKNISVDNIKFGYNCSPLLYDGFSISFECGKIYTLSGHNGSGKSTLINLISGIQQEFEGQIYYNNTPLPQLNLYEMRRKQIAFVEQEPVLFFDTIRENIIFGLDSTENLSKKIEEIGYQDFIQSFPDGLDTKINEKAANISGGEKQKIAIIRALIKNPDVLIMDEPNSALDKVSLQHLCQLLDKLKQDKIIIIISHHNDFFEIADVNYNLDQIKGVS